MAIHNGGAGKTLDRDGTPNRKNTDVNIQNNYHHKDTGEFEPKPYLETI